MSSIRSVVLIALALTCVAGCGETKKAADNSASYRASYKGDASKMPESVRQSLAKHDAEAATQGGPPKK